MNRNAVERLAEELFAEAHPGADVDGRLPEEFYRLARHVLKRERKARGRTEGYVAIVHQFGGHPAILLSRDGTTRENAEAQARAESGDVARLVFVPKKRRAR